ncbi:hypothetical protein C8R47DRAFT_1197680 [Mycena vitilis]|nr:hypothetical protein C8R47DRAFT_1197680 [Mycena vitilis]
MDTFPQELIHAIVEEIEEPQSLKSCSLLDTRFREPCQRILFSSLTLGLADCDPTPHYTCSYTTPDILARLLESPHIALYFKRLKWMLPEQDVTSGEVEALQEVLTQLPHVQYCEIIGGQEDLRPWSTVPPGLDLVIVEFIQRQRLTQLHVLSLEAVPLAMLILFLDAAPTVSLLWASVVDEAIEHSSAPFIVQNLFLSSCANVAKRFVDGVFLRRLANVRKLWMDPDWECGPGLLAAFSHQLEHIRLEHTGKYGCPVADVLDCFSSNHRSTDSTIPSPNELTSPPPPLPFLQSATIAIEFSDLGAPAFIARIASILTAPPPAFRELCISCSPTGKAAAAAELSLTPGTMEAVQSLIRPWTITPPIRWRLSLDIDNPIDNDFFDEFAASLRAGMATLHSQDRLIVERYPTSDWELDSWAL